MANAPAPLLWPLAVYFALVLALVGGLLAFSYYLGEGRRGRDSDQPFESGIVGIGFGHFRVSVDFYLIAMFFVIFDLEAAFLFAWAIALREAGWPGFVEAAIFIAILLAGLAYLWRLGGLDWGPHRQPPASPGSHAVRDQAA